MSSEYLMCSKSNLAVSAYHEWYLAVLPCCSLRGTLMTLYDNIPAVSEELLQGCLGVEMNLPSLFCLLGV